MYFLQDDFVLLVSLLINPNKMYEKRTCNEINGIVMKITTKNKIEGINVALHRYVYVFSLSMPSSVPPELSFSVRGRDNNAS